MHELSVTENILEISLRHAHKAGAVRVVKINLVIGQLSSILDDSVQFYWHIIAQNTPAAGAELYFERLPAKWQCLDCHQNYTAAADDLACPGCGGRRVKLVQGEEFYVESIEIEN